MPRLKQRQFIIALPTLFVGIFFHAHMCFAQETMSRFSGLVTTNKNEQLAAATVTLVHTPTNNTYSTKSRNNGRFYFSNVKPGGPYTLSISFVGYEDLIRKNIYIEYISSGYYSGSGDSTENTYVLAENNTTLQEVIGYSKKQLFARSGVDFSIHGAQISSMPSISRNLQDYVRLVPFSKTNGDGMMSFAGQNNKFNAFFIDGANNNDILGISMSGTNGGQTNTPPVSVEILDGIKVLLTPYDAQYGNFTGASINTITKSGDNDIKASAWYFFRNQNMAGRSPVPIERAGNPGVSDNPRLSPFFNQTFGIWTSGPIVKDKLFYFISVEKQIEEQPQVFNFSEYIGSSTQQQLNALSDTLRTRYGYDPGSFLNRTESVNATRTIAKIDWNISLKDKLTFSYRYNVAEKMTPRATGSTLLAYENNGFTVASRTHVASLDWQHYFGHDIVNRALLTYSDVLDDRKTLGEPFPQVIISDGPSRIYFGSHGASQFSRFAASDITAMNVLRVVRGINNVSAGMDLNLSKINDVLVPGYYGSYNFRSMKDFLNGEFPSRFTRSFFPRSPIIDERNAEGAKYKVSRIGLFLNDEISISSRLMLTLGVRVDRNSIPVNYRVDKFFNDTASKIISGYYNLHGAVTGNFMKTKLPVSPRIGFTYNFPKQGIVLSGGGGIFSGRILNAWISDIYNSTNLGSIDIRPSAWNMHFIADPFDQPSYDKLGSYGQSAKGTLMMMSKDFKFPSLFRTSLSLKKIWKNNFTFLADAMFTKNIQEVQITNVNLLPAKFITQLPDSRSVYGLASGPELIPLRPDGSNPYNAIYLMGNNNDKKGYSGGFSTLLSKAFQQNLIVTAGYAYLRSTALFEAYPGSSLGTMWEQRETVNGKNLAATSVSDMDVKHKITITISKKFLYFKSKAATTFCFIYNGQSGQPFSYVYSGTLINDAAQFSYDLMYIPTEKDLQKMTFLPNTVAGISYSPEEQKQMLDDYIADNKYLNGHRGKFAGRNEDRLPFTHIIDLRIQQDFTVKLNKKNTSFSLVIDIFNFTNLLYKNWGRIYYMPFDNFQLTKIAGVSSDPKPTPFYQFSPVKSKPYSVQSSTVPGNSARWICQVGIKMNLF